jgi:hypothetical protein
MTIKPTPSLQLEQILLNCEKIRKESYYHDYTRLNDDDETEVYVSLVTAIQRLAPQNSFYFEHLKKIVSSEESKGEKIQPLIGIVKSLKNAYESGYFYSLEQLIHAEMFSDFLDMANYLLQENYKDPAAVLIGGVLEGHLRKLCTKNSIPIEVDGKPRKIDNMNTELVKVGLYNRLEQKNVTAWADLRNKAAHALYNEYTANHVELAIEGIRNFILRFPA